MPSHHRHDLVAKASSIVGYRFRADIRKYDSVAVVAGVFDSKGTKAQGNIATSRIFRHSLSLSIYFFDFGCLQLAALNRATKLEEVLELKEGFDAFVAFCSREFCAESVQFWSRVNNFKKELQHLIKTHGHQQHSHQHHQHHHEHHRTLRERDQKEKDHHSLHAAHNATMQSLVPSPQASPHLHLAINSPSALTSPAAYNSEKIALLSPTGLTSSSSASSGLNLPKLSIPAINLPGTSPQPSPHTSPQPSPPRSRTPPQTSRTVGTTPRSETPTTSGFLAAITNLTHHHSSSPSPVPRVITPEILQHWLAEAQNIYDTYIAANAPFQVR